MAPLSLPLCSVVKHRDCLQRLNVLCNAVHGLRHRPITSRLWKRNFGAVTHGVGQLLSSQNRAPNYAASVFRSSSDGPDLTERLWSIYNDTRRQTEDLIPVISTNSVDPDTIFANNEMSLRDIEIYGFDYDYTLAFYSRHLHTLIFNIARDILISKHRYPEGLRKYEYIPNFAVRGLHYDVQKALLMKIDAFHYIQLGTVYRGLHPVPDEEVIAMYEGCHVPLEIMSDFYGKSSHGHTMKQFMDIFSLPEMTLLSCVNDFFMSHNIDYEPVHLYKDVKEAIRDVHVKGIMYRAVEADIEKYICYGEQSHAVLKKLSEHGKKMFLITNSPFDFVDRGMSYIVGKDWRDLFDVVIVQADKPGFFNDRRKPFRRVTDKGALLWDRIHRLEKGQIYKQGNLYEFLRLTGWRGSKVLYFGDHIYSDLASVDCNSTVAAAAQSLINVLTQNLNQNLSQGQQEPRTRQEQGPTSVDQEMARAFPGFFTRRSCLGKRRTQSLKTFGTAPTKLWKPFSFYAYLLNINSETTPTSSEEFELAQAGLGKRHVTMLKDMSHEEIFGLLQNEFPKMQGLTGGWLLHKATGGQGKRKLIMIPPDSNGYTGTQIRSVTGSGKITLYIVPLQHEFDLTPLPPDAIEFRGMPKAQCQTCQVSFPLQILALHVKECTESQSSAEETEPHQSEVQIVSMTASPLQHGTETSVEEKIPCPICFLQFTPQFLQLHASMCGERENAELKIDERNAMGQENGEELIKSVDDVLQTICQRVDAEKQFSIQISRTNILERGLLQWQRQKKNSPTATLKVTFFGEAGVDTGALRKEFLTEMVAGIERRFFEGLKHQKSPRYSLTDFDNGLYRIVGEILAVSLAQGGPAPAFFSPWTYSYLSGGQINPTVLNSDAVADVQLRNLIDQVELSTEQSLPDLADEILNCGYTGVISIQNKESIVRAVILHAVLRLQPMLDQIKEGLQLYDLLSLIRQYPDVCQSLFVPGEDVKVNAEFIMASICPQLSDKGTTRHQTELEIINFIQDFLYDQEAEAQGDGDDKESQFAITPARFLQWITGQGHIPILPSEKKDFAVIVKFNHDCNVDYGHHNICYPIVSACAKTITLPVKHMRSYDSFKQVLTEAFYLGQEFNIV